MGAYDCSRRSAVKRSLLAVVLCSWIGCSGRSCTSEQTAPTVAGDSGPKPTTRAAEHPTEREAARQPSLVSAVAYARPFMGDDEPLAGAKIRDPRIGWRLVRAWGREHMTWEILETADSPDVEKLWAAASDAAGQLVCVRGALRQREHPDEPPEIYLDPGKRHWAKLWLVNPVEGLPVAQAARACGVFVGAFDDRRDHASGIVIVGLNEPVDLLLEKSGSRPSTARFQ